MSGMTHKEAGNLHVKVACLCKGNCVQGCPCKASGTKCTKSYCKCNPSKCQNLWGKKAEKRKGAEYFSSDSPDDSATGSSESTSDSDSSDIDGVACDCTGKCVDCPCAWSGRKCTKSYCGCNPSKCENLWGKKKKQTPSKAKTSKESKAKKHKSDVNAPKRNQNSWQHFCKANRPRLQQLNPTKSMTEITTLLSGAWQMLSAQEKKSWEAVAAKDKERYEREQKSDQKTEGLPSLQELQGHNTGAQGESVTHHNPHMMRFVEAAAPAATRATATPTAIPTAVLAFNSTTSSASRPTKLPFVPDFAPPAVPEFSPPATAKSRSEQGGGERENMRSTSGSSKSDSNNPAPSVQSSGFEVVIGVILLYFLRGLFFS